MGLHDHQVAAASRLGGERPTIFQKGRGESLWRCRGAAGRMGNSSGAAAVEAEGKLLEVAVEVFAAHRPLVRAEDPAFDGGGVNPRQHGWSSA